MMRYRVWIILFWICSVLFLLGMNTVQASNFIANLNFGSITVLAETTREQFFEMSLKKPGARIMEVHVEALLQSETGVTLPPERLQVFTTGKTQQLSKATTKISLTQGKVRGEEEHHELSLLLKLLPDDPPGWYTAKVKLCPLMESGKIDESQICEIMITCEIAKWFLLKTPNCPLTLKSPITPGSNVLANQSPYYLELAANAPWKLYVSLSARDAECNTIKDALQMQLTPADTQIYHGVFPSGVALSTEPILLAEGLGTVNDGEYWIKLPIILKIENYTQILAGKAELPICFVILESKP